MVSIQYLQILNLGRKRYQWRMAVGAKKAAGALSELRFVVELMKCCEKTRLLIRLILHRKRTGRAEAAEHGATRAAHVVGTTAPRAQSLDVVAAYSPSPIAFSNSMPAAFALAFM